MERVIYEYKLNFTVGKVHTTIRLPEGSKIVHVGYDGWGNICVWINRPKDSPDAITEQFMIVGTGESFEDCWHYVGAVKDPEYIWHVLRFQRDG